jgi:hypothetical protein
MLDRVSGEIALIAAHPPLGHLRPRDCVSSDRSRERSFGHPSERKSVSVLFRRTEIGIGALLPRSKKNCHDSFCVISKRYALTPTRRPYSRVKTASRSDKTRSTIRSVPTSRPTAERSPMVNETASLRPGSTPQAGGRSVRSGLPQALARVCIGRRSQTPTQASPGRETVERVVRPDTSRPRLSVPNGPLRTERGTGDLNSRPRRTWRACKDTGSATPAYTDYAARSRMHSQNRKNMPCCESQVHWGTGSC